MESIRTHYYDVTKVLLSFVGQWPYQTRRARRFRFSLATIFAFWMIAPQINKFIWCDGDMQCIISTIPSYLLTIMIITKLYACQFNSNNIKYLTDHIFDNWKILKTSEEYEIMKAYAENGRWLALMYSVCCVFSMLLFMLMALIPCILDILLPLNESRPVMLPYEAYYFVDEREYFFYIFLYGFVIAHLAIMGLLAHDSMILTYTEHVCSVFAVAGFRFEHLSCKRTGIAEIINSHRSANTYNKRMAFCVQVHYRALEFAEILENSFSATFGIQIAMATIGMSITLIQITLQSADIIEWMRYVIYVGAQLVHLSCFSMQGQKLIDHSFQMRDKIYNTSWYKIPVKSQKLLLHVMGRSLQHSSLSASRMYIFSMENLATVIKTAVSYFTLLQSFQ